MSDQELRFETIDLDRDAATAVAFRRDSYICSFGSDEALGRVEDYLDWLKKRLVRAPLGHVHVWRGSAIIGQLEFLVVDGPPTRGYVNLFYLVPDERGRGLGDALHRYVLNTLQAAGCQSAQLHVSPTNHRAVAFYEKHGWRDCGPKPQDRSVHLFQRSWAFGA